MKRLFLLLALLLFALPAHATNAVFLANVAAGANDGSSCANAKAGVAYFNNAANWSGSPTGIQIGPDTTVHLCGTFSGSAGASFFVVQGSGTSGHPVIILFESGASITAPAFTFFGGAFDSGGHSWITIDSAVTGLGTEGLITNTDNGSSGAFGNSSGGRAIEFDGPSTGITITHLNVTNICQHTLATDSIGCNTGGNGTTDIFFQGGASQIRVTQNTLHDVENGIGYVGAAGDAIVELDHNTISRVNWGFALATIGSSTGLNVHDNDITCVVASPCNWNDNGNSFHHNGMIVFPQGASDIMHNMVVSNNFIHDFNTATGGIFLDPASGDCPGIQIYNNVFFTTAGQVGPSDGWIVSGIGITNSLIVNNTIVGPTATGMNGGGSGFPGPTMKNNIVLNSGSFGIVLDPGFTGVASDFNSFFGLSVSDAMAAEPNFYATVADWVAGTGFDTHSITTDPLVSAAFLLNSSSPARGTGTNLTSLGIAGLAIGAPQTFGAGGTCGTGCLARPAVGAWDMGAYPFSAASPAPAVGLSPTSVAFGNQTVNTTSGSQVITLTNTGTATLNITSITLTGANASQFAKSTTCGSTLAAGINCTVSVTFTPTSVGAKTAAVTFTTDASTSPDNDNLTGTGVISVPTVPTGKVPMVACNFTNSSHNSCACVTTNAPATWPTLPSCSVSRHIMHITIQSAAPVALSGPAQ